MRPKLLFISLMLISLISSAQEKKFKIIGTVPSSEKKYHVKLRWGSGEREKEVAIANGKFVITGSIDAPIKALLRISEVGQVAENSISVSTLSQNSLELFLDEGTITVTTKTTLSLAEVNGTNVVNDFQSYKRRLIGINELLAKIYDVKRNYPSQSEPAQILSEIIKKHADLVSLEEMEFIKAHTTSPISLYLIKNFLGYDMDVTKALPAFSLLSDSLLKTESGKKIQEMIEVGKRSMVGATAPDFSQPDADGKMISLSSFKGKYVLIDFWASWCVPCRAESPNLVKAYERFKNSNFEIIGVTLDEKKDKWLKAVKEDNYTWPQVGDMKGWENAAALQFGVLAVPFNMIVDPNGVVVARNLRGEALEKKLEEILK
ncbi:AhpC/TSA family protein [Lacibacter luteus]|uniref:AhpC/TSA family protein n=2 Tax=Pseudomonadati TaxID=3379134 RepID=A0A4Q1CMB1_9BACT|nr:TlpA disulfide reductase family protein [Lacibacter luteus]RXK62187.1 AhpC/TSA family protein [Lacibacter luteus]